MAPILLGLAVMCWRMRQQPVSRANPRSPRQRGERWMALRVWGIDIKFAAVCGLLDRDMHADAGAPHSRDRPGWAAIQSSAAEHD